MVCPVRPGWYHDDLALDGGGRIVVVVVHEFRGDSFRPGATGIGTIESNIDRRAVDMQ